MEVHTWICVLFLLTHQYKTIVGQSSERFYRYDDELTEIPTDISPEVVAVTIYSRQITTIKANAFLQLSQCKNLRLGSNISEIEPGAFNGLTALTILSLTYNRLDRIYVNMFSGINSCKGLDLERNEISEIEPGSFDGLDNLEWLHVDNNRLTTLRSGMFRGLSKCTQIFLYENWISEIETGSFNGLSALVILSMEDNRLKRLYRNMFSDLTNCAQLRLSYNQISVIEPGSFNGLGKLNQLGLSYNHLTELRAEIFIGLHNVELLYLSGNNLTTLRAGAFQGLLPALYLGLATNNINLIDENAFSGLTKLEYLDLNENELDTLNPGIFCGLQSLRRLTLARNQFTSLTKGVFYHLPRPFSRDLSGNQLQCDAALCWLKQEELNGTITWYQYDTKLSCANKVNWDTWLCNEAVSVGSVNTTQCKAITTTNSPETTTATTDSPETTMTTSTETQTTNDNNSWWILISVAAVVVLISMVIIVICVKRRGVNICQGSSQDGKTQNTDTSSNNFPVGFNNEALSVETENEAGYQSLQIQRNDYEQLRHSIKQTGDGSGSIHAGYVDVLDYPTSLPRPSVSVISTTVSMATEDESGYTLPNKPHEGYIEVKDYNSV